MRSTLFRIAWSITLLGSALVLPASASAQQQPAANVITLLDGTECRGRTGEAPFSAVNVRANYECDDGRWVMGEPLNLGDGRRVAMLAQVIGQGRRLRDGDEPCEQAECVVGLGQAEVATSTTLPRSIRLDGGTNCTFQDGETFYVGTLRANYLCEQRAFGVPPGAETWIIGGPITRVTGLNFVLVTGILREGVAVDPNRPGGATCRDPICVTGTIPQTVDPRTPLRP